MTDVFTLRNPIWTKESIPAIFENFTSVHTIIFDQNYDPNDSVFIDISKISDTFPRYNPIINVFFDSLSNYNETALPTNRILHLKFINQLNQNYTPENTWFKLDALLSFIEIPYLQSISYGTTFFPTRPVMVQDLNIIFKLMCIANSNLNMPTNKNSLTSLFLFGDTFENERNIYRQLRAIENPNDVFWTDFNNDDKLYYLDYVRHTIRRLSPISDKLFANGKISAEIGIKDMEMYNSVPSQLRTSTIKYLPQDIQHIVSSFMMPRKL